MRTSKNQREYRRQTGQYMTPKHIVDKIVSGIDASNYRRILEPSCGEGIFIDAIAKKADVAEIVGIEIDPVLASRARNRAQNSNISIHCEDFFCNHFVDGSFDLIIGNPPFGGTFNPAIEDELDRNYGNRHGRKIKKETYAFFIVASVDLLRDGGRMVFVCSDTLLTIPTMTGLRQYLMESGKVEISTIESFSKEIQYPMIVLDFVKGKELGTVIRCGNTLPTESIRATPNSSWGIVSEYAHLFQRKTLGDYLVATSGMTTGKNSYFVRKVDVGQQLYEHYDFEFYDAPITVQDEAKRARMGQIPAKRRKAIEQAELAGQTERRLKVTRKAFPDVVQLPDDRYCPYNKANGRLVFSEPTHYIYWENDGDAVLTHKKTGNWYLKGVGGQPHFGKEGITWPLVASRFIPRYIPQGYILDSGSPCAFLRDGVDQDELYFVLGWLLSSLASDVLKTVINHTMNIQGKDFERMPYPWWVSGDERQHIISAVKAMIADAREGKRWQWEDAEIRELDERFAVLVGKL